MPCSCGDYRPLADRQFTAAKAAKELKAYRRGRVGPTTRLLRDGIVKAGLNHGSLLDIGAGIGALTFELLSRGMPRAVIADASAAYVGAATEEASRVGRTDSVQIVHGDFMYVSESIVASDVVTLDRVICCYPTYQPMLEQATSHARHVLALSYPKERWYVKAVVWLENARRARKTTFRTFVHSASRMQRIIERAGFSLSSRRGTLVWAVDIYVKHPVEAGL